MAAKGEVLTLDVAAEVGHVDCAAEAAEQVDAREKEKSVIS